MTETEHRTLTELVAQFRRRAKEADALADELDEKVIRRGVAPRGKPSYEWQAGHAWGMRLARGIAADELERALKGVAITDPAPNPSETENG